MASKDVQSWIGHIIKDTYRIDGPLGEGGQSVVYRGIDIMMGMPVAIKHFKRFSKGVENNSERFLREAQTQAKLVHQNIVGIRSIHSEIPDDATSEDDKEYFIVMEFVDGGSLVDMIESANRQEPATEEIGRIFEQILDGLGFAHRKGVLHRDVKPSNILLTEDRQVKLADFGLARVLEAKRLTQTGLVLGTPAYIAPEQIDGSGDIDHRCDIYSVGVMLYEVFCGHPPFQKPGENLAPFELMGRHLFMEPPSLIELGIPIPQDLEDVIMKGLAKRADERFADCKQFRDALGQAIRGEPSTISTIRSAADLDTLNSPTSLASDPSKARPFASSPSIESSNNPATAPRNYPESSSNHSIAYANHPAPSATSAFGDAAHTAHPATSAFGNAAHTAPSAPNLMSSPLSSALPQSGTLPTLTPLHDLPPHPPHLSSRSSGILAVSPADISNLKPRPDSSGTMHPPSFPTKQPEHAEKTVVQTAVDPSHLRDDTDAFARQDDVDYSMQTVIQEGIPFARWEEEARQAKTQPADDRSPYDTFPEGLRAPADAVERSREMLSRSRSRRSSQRTTSMVPFALLLFAAIMLIGVWWFFYGRDQIHAPSPRSNQSYPKKLPDVTMQSVPSGFFYQGHDHTLPNGRPPDYSPQRKIRLSAFWLDTFEVTVAQYAHCIKAKSCSEPPDFASQQAMPYAPVVSVSWGDARRFCAWNQKRLPTEAEWEKAARGGIHPEKIASKTPLPSFDPKQPYPWGLSAPDCSRARISGCEPPSPLMVAKNFRISGRSPYGLYDMIGNVREWVEDCYVQRAYAPEYGRLVYTEGCQNPNKRVVRGGSFKSERSKLTVYARGWAWSISGQKDIGFRCAWSPTP